MTKFILFMCGIFGPIVMVIGFFNHMWPVYLLGSLLWGGWVGYVTGAVTRDV